MNDRHKVPPVEAWKAIDAMVSQEELDRIKGLSEREVDEELAAAGFDLDEMRTVGQEIIENAARKAGIGVSAAKRAAPRQPPLPPAEQQASLPPTASRRSLWVAWSTAAAIAAAAIAVFVISGPGVVAMIRHKVADMALPKRELPPDERAAQLRENAFKECESERWETCEDLLEEARRLNPAGESDPRVKQWRWLMLPQADGGAPRLDTK